MNPSSPLAYAIVPPVFHVEGLTAALIDDLSDASKTYWGYDYTTAFDDLFLVPERARAISGFLAGDFPALAFAECIREWLLKPWSSTRTIGTDRMRDIGIALGNVRSSIAAIPSDLSLERADHSMLTEMVRTFGQLDDCHGVGPTIASKLLAPLRPALFPMWDNPIAESYGFALNAAGYHQYLRVTQAIACKAREFWKSVVPLEQHLMPFGRRWIAPLAKVIDEWNWIRITRKHRYPSSETRDLRVMDA